MRAVFFFTGPDKSPDVDPGGLRPFFGAIGPGPDAPRGVKVVRAVRARGGHGTRPASILSLAGAGALTSPSGPQPGEGGAGRPGMIRRVCEHASPRVARVAGAGFGGGSRAWPGPLGEAA